MAKWQKFKIKPEARLVEDFKADVNDITEMIMRVEEGFEIEVSYEDEDIEKLKRVSDFYDFVEKYLREKLKKPKPTEPISRSTLQLHAFSQTNLR